MTDPEKLVYAAAFVAALNGDHSPRGGQAGWNYAVAAAAALRAAGQAIEALRYAQQNAELYNAKHIAMLKEEHALQEQLGLGIDERERLATTHDIAERNKLHQRRTELRAEFPVQRVEATQIFWLEEFLGMKGPPP